MTPDQKKILRTLVLELRHQLEGWYDADGHWQAGDLETRLAALGVRRGQAPRPVRELAHLNEEDRTARQAVDTYLTLRQAAGISLDAAVAEFIREAAYSWANRLLALRCMEARELLDPQVIEQKEAYGGKSLAHQRLTQREPALCQGEDGGLVTVLRRAFTAQAVAYPRVFNPQAAAVALQPSTACLTQIIRLLSGTERLRGQMVATPAVFAAPDALGWAYQFWNSEEKARIDDRYKEQKTKIEGADIVPETQLYTEHYMVQFLLQNSLGATWAQMHPGSRLPATWPMWFAQADRAPLPADAPRHLRDLTLLDPACGSGHFLIEAANLLWSMYEEEGEVTDPVERATAILTRNLHGLDIDARAIQIAEITLGLWAAEKVWQAAGAICAIAPTGLLATNLRLPRGEAALTGFLARHPDDVKFKPALEQVFAALQHADEIGALLNIEVVFDRALDQLRESLAAGGQAVQQTLFAPVVAGTQITIFTPPELGTIDWKQWRSDLIARLAQHFAEEARVADPVAAAFGASASEALRIIAVMTKGYDVVVANPPYMGSKKMGPVLLRHVGGHYAAGKRDLFAAFILRCRELAKPGGRVAMVTQQSWMFLSSYADLRTGEHEDGLLHTATLESLAHLGPGAWAEIGGEVVNSALFTFVKAVPPESHRLTAARLVGGRGPDEKERGLLAAARDGSNLSKIRQSVFLKIPSSPLSYWLTPRLLDILVTYPRLNTIADVRQGLATCDNQRFLRCVWEVPTDSRWVPYAKGGRYQKWAGLEWLVVDWQFNGRRVKRFVVTIPGNESYSRRVASESHYFRNGLTYTQMCRGSLGTRLLQSSIFDVKSMTIFPNHVGIDLHGLSALLTNRTLSYFLRVVTQNLEFHAGYVAQAPVVAEALDELAPLGQCTRTLKLELAASDGTESQACASAIAQDTQRLAAVLHSAEAAIEHQVMTAFALGPEDRAQILAETGTPAGFQPLVTGYDRLPVVPDLTIPDAVHQHVASLPHIPADAALRSKVQAAFTSGAAGDDATDTDEEGPEADDDGETTVVGGCIPIPAETFLERLSLQVGLHPISVAHLIAEGTAQHGWRCLSEERRLLADRLTVAVLRCFGHRWPAEIRAGMAPIADADADGIIPLSEDLRRPDNSIETTLAQRVAPRLAEFGLDLPGTERLARKVFDTDLTTWLHRSFAAHHGTQFKRRPLVWQIQSRKPRGDRSPTCALALYYHKLDGDLLPKLRRSYLAEVIRRAETESRTLAAVPAAARSDRQSARVAELEQQLDDLRAMDQRVQEIEQDGFRPSAPAQRDRLQTIALTEAWHSLIGRWLDRLNEHLAPTLLPTWATTAAAANLCDEAEAWLRQDLGRLAVWCTDILPVPKASTLPADPAEITTAILAPRITDEAFHVRRKAVDGSLSRWRHRVDRKALAPLREELKATKEQTKQLRKVLRNADPTGDQTVNNGLRAQLAAHERRIAVVEKELERLTEGLKATIDPVVAWLDAADQDPALTWAPWLAAQPLYDRWTSIDGARPLPASIPAFVAQECRYWPDLNDGVRVNIAPFQRAGLLAFEPLQRKDIEEALSDRITWRADERKWVRQGDLPQPGWWPVQALREAAAP
jgi:hypothetical protein